MSPVEVFSFNPLRQVIPGFWGRLIPLRRRLNNFGDLLGPLIVKKMLVLAAGNECWDGDFRVLTVGSVLHFARNGDVVWGTGRNGKVLDGLHQFSSLDVRAVRGPLTREYLLCRGINAPPIYGDPALLLSYLMPELAIERGRDRADYLFVPNYNDLSWGEAFQNVLDPCSPLGHCLTSIVSSRFVVATSLHAIIVAESFGVPARLIRSRVEDDFKYEDYYLGSGRSNFMIAENLQQALDLGGEPPPVFDQDALIRSFPFDVWGKSFA